MKPTVGDKSIHPTSLALQNTRRFLNRKNLPIIQLRPLFSLSVLHNPTLHRPRRFFQHDGATGCGSMQPVRGATDQSAVRLLRAKVRTHLQHRFHRKRRRPSRTVLNCLEGSAALHKHPVALVCPPVQANRSSHRNSTRRYQKSSNPSRPRQQNLPKKNEIV
jgi:hypothetical protein